MLTMRSSNSTATLMDLYGPVREYLERVQRIFDTELVSERPYVNQLMERIQAYRGKMLRPALLLLAGQSVGDLTDDHHVLAAVIEMVHVATLVHDDVLDEADERRRRPTICSAEGNTAAVLLGDYLISHAYHLCSSLQDPYASRRIAATTNIVCEGEMLQNAHRGNLQLTESAYLDLIRCKTGALTAVACELGARFARAEPVTVESLREFGMTLGIAFQIIDDVLDIRGDPIEVGKTLALDFAMGKLTLPTLHGLAHAGATAAEELRSSVVQDRPYRLESLREILAETGSIEYAMGVASAYIRHALECIASLPPSDAKDSLSALAEFVVQRSM